MPDASAPTLPPGTYTIRVHGYNGAKAAYALDVLAPRPYLTMQVRGQVGGREVRGEARLASQARGVEVDLVGQTLEEFAEHSPFRQTAP